MSPSDAFFAAKADLADASRRLDEARARYARAQRDYDRARDIYRRDYVSGTGWIKDAGIDLLPERITRRRVRH